MAANKKILHQINRLNYFSRKYKNIISNRIVNFILMEPLQTQKEEIDTILNKIYNAWNSYLFKYKFCFSKLNSGDDLKTNYFGDLMGYFTDTLEIVFDSTPPKARNYTEMFTFNISFLQAIYVQQDFLEELLLIFKTGVSKGELKKDINYYVNRDLRNELIGHPIRKLGNKLISSTLFSYDASEGEIQYARYHRDNNFRFEVKSFDVLDIRARHYELVRHYLNLIAKKIESIVTLYSRRLNQLLSIINKVDFIQTLDFCSQLFEDFFNQEFCFEYEVIKKIYEKREAHFRYQHVIDRFLSRLFEDIQEVQNDIEKFCNPRPITKSLDQNIPIELWVSELSVPFHNKTDIKKKRSYSYELSKLYTSKNEQFNFFARILREDFKNHKKILNEILHMEFNLGDNFEYYSALKYLSFKISENQK